MNSYHPGIELRQPNTDNSINILTVADLDWRYGHEYSLQALKSLKDQGFVFHYKMVGTGPFLEAIAFARHELDLHAQVDLILKITPKELDRLYAWANIFLLAAVLPETNHAMQKAIQRNLPIICSNIFNKAILPNSYFFEPRCPASIVEAIKQPMPVI